MNIELKDFNIQKTTKLLIDLIQKHNIKNQLIVSSFKHEYYQELKAYNLDIHFQFLFNSEFKREFPFQSVYDICNRGTMNIFYGYITEEMVKEIHSKNFGVLAWCNKTKTDKVNVEEDEETFYNLIKMGVDIICTNKPDIVLQARNRFINNHQKI